MFRVKWYIVIDELMVKLKGKKRLHQNNILPLYIVIDRL